ncbi:glycosyltransferase family 25 protein [Zopfia rhizophila CBS 207.26]|uniref:Glycosyltransferase family 25 protein n=1 Tax=Zopfia rhizophila CBS 207.26 TaxID=1314779 RepID=A0A6A6DLF7_9PEZI|nr:glycosyltransferase family 25 protein [Zopfia rhizophila CBS 207.26]
MDILQKIVEENITSALILEDDADWDLCIKSQIQGFAKAAQVLVQPCPEHWISSWIPHILILPNASDHTTSILARMPLLSHPLPCMEISTDGTYSDRDTVVVVFPRRARRWHQSAALSF